MSIKPLLGVVDGCMDLSDQEGTGGCLTLRGADQACGYPALRCGEQGLSGDRYRLVTVGRSRRRRRRLLEGSHETK